MKTQFSLTNPGNLVNVKDFLSSVFLSAPDAIFVQPDLLVWKYFAPHPFFPGGRSVTLDVDGVIAAHGAASPFRLNVQGRSLSSIQVIDWAAGKIVPGSGLLVYRNFLTLADLLFAIGGSDDAQVLFKSVRWFRELPPVQLLARPIRPFRQIWSSRSTLKRDGGRLLRNLAWANRPRLPESRSWSCQRVERFTRSKEFAGQGEYGGLIRDVDWLNYLLGCPAASMHALELSLDDKWRGHAVISCVGKQARITDLAIDSMVAADWRGAVAAVTKYCARQWGVFEIVTGSTIPHICAAFGGCGYRSRGTLPVYLADPKKLITVDLAIELNLALGDAFYLSDPARPFWT